MVADVVSLREVEKSPSADVVAILQELLALAKSGELIAIGVASVKTGGITSYVWNGGDNGHYLLAAMIDMQWELCQQRAEMRREREGT